RQMPTQIKTPGDVATSYLPTYNSSGGGSCSGIEVPKSDSGTVNGTPTLGPVLPGSDSDNSQSYVLDVEAPTLNVQSVLTDPIAQNANQGVHTKIDDGSAIPGTSGPDAGQSYTLTYTV